MTHTAMNPLVRQSGISLVEVLVSLVISLFLLGGIVQVYVGNKTTFAFTNALAEIQENGRFALDSMGQDLRLVGDWGCVPFDPTDTSNINDTLDGTTVPGYTAALYDFVNQPAISGTNNGTSDTLTLHGTTPGLVNVESPFTTATTQTIDTAVINTLAVNDIILIARCGENDLLNTPEVDILRVTGVAPVNGNTQRRISLSANKSQQFENDAVVLEMQTVTYSIAPGASGEPALWRSTFGNNVELVEGVENFQVLYGIDSDADLFANQYVTSDKVLNNGQDVVSVRIMLQVRSSNDFVTESPQTYTFNGVQMTAADRRIRQTFTATIALRNRVGSS